MPKLINLKMFRLFAFLFTFLPAIDAFACGDNETDQCIGPFCACVFDPSKALRSVPDLVNAFGRQLTAASKEVLVQEYAPVLEAALLASRSTSIGDSQPIPADIRRKLTGYVPEDSLARVRFKIGDNGFINLANISINYGDAAAVTLVDVVVFKDKQTARDLGIWAHELRHVQQFAEWGTRDFSIRYLRDYHSVEAEAYGFEYNYPEWSVKNNIIDTSLTTNDGNLVSVKSSVFLCSGFACVAGDIPLGAGRPTQYGDVNHSNSNLSMKKPVKNISIASIDGIIGNKDDFTLSPFEMSAGALTPGPAAKHFTICGWTPNNESRRARLTLVFDY